MAEREPNDDAKFVLWPQILAIFFSDPSSGRISHRAEGMKARTYEQYNSGATFDTAAGELQCGGLE